MERIHDSDGGEHVQRKKKVWNKISSVSVRHFILLEPWPSTLYINMHKVSRAASLTEKGNTDFANCDAFFSFSFRGKKQLKSEAIMKHFSRIYILFVTFIYSSAVRGHTKLQHEYLFSFFFSFCTNRTTQIMLSNIHFIFSTNKLNAGYSTVFQLKSVTFRIKY